MALTDLLLVIGGFVAGALGGALGIGGGVVVVPGLTLLLGVPQTLAQGSSLAMIVPTSLVGALTQDREGNVVRARILPMALLGVVGAGAGALLALALPTGVLARLFGAFLILSAFRLWRS